jgi:hypothetical protein
MKDAFPLIVLAALVAVAWSQTSSATTHEQLPPGYSWRQDNDGKWVLEFRG